MTSVINGDPADTWDDVHISGFVWDVFEALGYEGTDAEAGVALHRAGELNIVADSDRGYNWPSVSGA